MQNGMEIWDTIAKFKPEIKYYMKKRPWKIWCILDLILFKRSKHLHEVITNFLPGF
jgi:hypothetical protein